MATPTRNTRFSSSLAVAFLLLGSGACAVGGQQDEGIVPRGDAVTVEVDNASFDDVRVYLVRGGSRELLDVVGAASRAAIRIPLIQLGNGDLELLAVPRSSSAPVREVRGVQVFPGDVLQWSMDNGRAVYSILRR